MQPGVQRAGDFLAREDQSQQAHAFPRPAPQPGDLLFQGHDTARAARPQPPDVARQIDDEADQAQRQYDQEAQQAERGEQDAADHGPAAGRPLPAASAGRGRVVRLGHRRAAFSRSAGWCSGAG